MAIPGSIWIDGEYLHFLDASNNDYQYLGNYYTSAPAAIAGSIWIDVNGYLNYLSVTHVWRQLPFSVDASGVGNANSVGSIWIESSRIKGITASNVKANYILTSAHSDHTDNISHSDHSDYSDSPHDDEAHTDHTDSGVNHHTDSAYSDGSWHADIPAGGGFPHTDHNDHADAQHADYTDHYNDVAYVDYPHYDYPRHNDIAAHSDHIDIPAIVYPQYVKTV